MRSRTQQPILQVLAKSIVDGEGHDQRSDSGRDSGDRNASDHANDGLASFSAEIAGRDEEFEAHRRSISFSRQLSADWIIATAPSVRTSAGPYPGYDCRYGSPVLAVFFAEPPLQFPILGSDHDGACNQVRTRSDHSRPPARSPGSRPASHTNVPDIPGDGPRRVCPMLPGAVPHARRRVRAGLLVGRR